MKDLSALALGLLEHVVELDHPAGMETQSEGMKAEWKSMIESNGGYTIPAQAIMLGKPKAEIKKATEALCVRGLVEGAEYVKEQLKNDGPYARMRIWRATAAGIQFIRNLKKAETAQPVGCPALD